MISTVETERLKLLSPTADNFPVYEAFYGDAEASNMYGGPLSREQIWARLKADLGSWYLMGFGVWIVQEKETGDSIGTCGFWKGKDWPRELTWWLLPDARGKGFAREASIAAIRHAFDQWHWDCVETYMNDENTAARNLVERLGGQKVRRSEFPDGLYRDIYQFVCPE
ncbi:GNAT family N-acetyltransferase [Pseudoteredinibacter isoporae]|uniref:GNAT family N-acetyltransferase n=1 Tax=Pseudoteredinibacter isoporae TaxID=570281 RepID=UPI0031091E55